MDNMESRISNNESRSIQSFTDLDVWQEGHALVILIYRITKVFPKDEQFGLTSQMRRAAVSITSNIAEGFSRRSYREKLQFYSMAEGSLTELQNQILVARDVQYLQEKDVAVLLEQSIKVHKILNKFIKKTQSFCN